jgi:phage portal protein BeeE
MPRGSTATIKPLGPIAAAITRTTIRGVDSSSWFGPLQPVSPVAPKGTQPRLNQYQPGQNLTYTPRADRFYKAEELRALAAYPLARMCIENVKDMICRMPITARLKRQAGESGADHKKRSETDKVLPVLQQMIEQPNPEQTRQDFVRDVLEDMLVGDWASVLVEPSSKGKAFRDMHAIDGSIITRYIDDRGFTPQAPLPAYAQLWYGIPMVDLTTDQLVYAMRNRKRDGIYGYSPTEQGALELQVGIDRLAFVSQFYKSGTVPDGMQIVPMGVEPDKVKESQDWLDSTLAGQLARRRGMRLIQGFTTDGKDQIIFPKDKALADAFDDLHIRRVAFLYGTSPQRLLKTLNRASADANQDAAEEEGTMPWIDWLVNRIYNWIFQRLMGLTDYEVTIDSEVETDVVKQAEADKSDVSCGIKLVDEVRKDRGLDPYPNSVGGEPMIITPTGPVPLDPAKAADRAGQMSAAVIPDADPEDDGKKPSKPSGKNPPKKKPSKAYSY